MRIGVDVGGMSIKFGLGIACPGTSDPSAGVVVALLLTVRFLQIRFVVAVSCGIWQLQKAASCPESLMNRLSGNNPEKYRRRWNI